MVDILGGLQKFGQFADKVGTELGELQIKNLVYDDPKLYAQIMGDRGLQKTREEELEMRKQQRAMQIEELRRQRAQQEKVRGFLGNLGQRQQGLPVEGQVGPTQPMDRSQILGQLATLTGDPNLALQAYAPEPTEFQQQMQTLGMLMQMPEDTRELYRSVYGKGGTTVNVGGETSPFQKKFEEGLGSGLADRVSTLQTEASDFMSQANSAEQALNILQSNPNIDISPTSKISTQAKSLFAPFLNEDQLKDVADYQTLESQLIRNRFDVTKVLKGAITEQEQAAAQQVAGSATGTRQGLAQTLKNNMAYAALEADYRQRKADYIKRVGRNYSEKEFNDYYKALGESGQRPTLESMLGQTMDTQQIIDFSELPE